MILRPITAATAIAAGILTFAGCDGDDAPPETTIPAGEFSELFEPNPDIIPPLTGADRSRQTIGDTIYWGVALCRPVRALASAELGSGLLTNPWVWAQNRPDEGRRIIAVNPIRFLTTEPIDNFRTQSTWLEPGEICEEVEVLDPSGLPDGSLLGIRRKGGPTLDAAYLAIIPRNSSAMIVMWGEMPELPPVDEFIDFVNHVLDEATR